MYFYALSRGRAAPMLELVTQAYNSCSWRMGQSCADALSPQGNPPAVSRPRRMFMISSCPVRVSPTDPRIVSLRSLDPFGRTRKARVSRSQARLLTYRLMRFAGLPGCDPSTFYEQA